VRLDLKAVTMGEFFPLRTSISSCQQNYTNTRILRSLSTYYHFLQKERQPISFFYRAAPNRNLLSAICVSIQMSIFLLLYKVS
jgi:hypothetical protein